MNISRAYKLTGFVVLVVGILFFLRDVGINLIGNTSGWTIIIVLVGASLLAGGAPSSKQLKLGKSKDKASM